MNVIHLLGRVGKDPEIKTFQNGDRIANFSIATSERWKDKQTGERKEKPQWHNVTVKGDGLVGVVQQYLGKGDMVRVSGVLEYRQWENKEGVKMTSAEIVVGMKGELQLLGGKSDNQGAAPRERETKPNLGKSFADDLEGEIPF